MRAMIRWSLALLLPLAACSQPQPPMQAVTPQAVPTPVLSAQDQRFVHASGASDIFEIESSQLALRKTRSPAIRRFADRMIRDHNQTMQLLTSIVSAKGLTPAPAMNAQQQQMMSQLEGMNGGTFGQYYRNDQIQGHQQAIQAFPGRGEQWLRRRYDRICAADSCRSFASTSRWPKGCVR